MKTDKQPNFNHSFIGYIFVGTYVFLHPALYQHDLGSFCGQQHDCLCLFALSVKAGNLENLVVGQLQSNNLVFENLEILPSDRMDCLWQLGNSFFFFVQGNWRILLHGRFVF